MVTFKALIAVFLVVLNVTVSSSNPFGILERRSNVPGREDNILSRQGRNSKLTNLGRLKDTHTTKAPLALDTNAAPLAIAEEVTKEEKATEKLVDAEEFTEFEIAATDEVEKSADASTEEPTEEEYEEEHEEVEEEAVIAEKETETEAEKVVQKVNKKKDEIKIIEATSTIEEKIEDPSMDDLESAVTEVMMNSLLKELVDQEEREGKYTEDRIGLTQDNEYNIQQEQEGGLQFNGNWNLPNSILNPGVFPFANSFTQQQPNSFTQQQPNSFTQQQPNYFPQQQPNSFYNPTLYQQHQFQYPQQHQDRTFQVESGLLNEIGQREFGGRQTANTTTTVATTTTTVAPATTTAAPSSSSTTITTTTAKDDGIRCINKVMQVEEIVYEDRIKCEHSFTEKCHDTYITDYVPTQEQKCENSFKKNCRITYKAVVFEEKVQVCNEPLKKVCGNGTIGAEVCSTHYETICETKFNEHIVEQDEPVCEMVIERKCNGVAVPLPDTTSPARRRRQAFQPQLINGDFSGNELTADFSSLQRQNDFVTIGNECEEWPIQKCRLEKVTVKKTNPETACEKIPKEICAPSNCELVQSEKICNEEVRNLVQNIPSEECDLEPQEDCKMETVLVPRLVQQPNCIQVPKEVCVNARTNPKKVKKPVIKEWCYNPKDLKYASSRQTLNQILLQ